MEPISAIASFIAIGQALAAAPKIIDALSSLIKVRQEVIELLNEIEWLDSIGRHIGESIKTLPAGDPTAGLSIQQRYQLQGIASDLKSIVSQLEELAQTFQRGTKEDGQLKIDRLSWFRKRGKIASLSKQAKKNRERLQEILNCCAFFASMHTHKLILEIHSTMTTQAHTGNTLLLPFINQGYPIHEIESFSTDNGDHRTVEEITDTGTSIVGIATLDGDSRQSSPPSMTGGDSLQAPFSGQGFQSHEPLIQMTATLRRSCPKKCACQCHSPTSRPRPHWAMSPIYGWLGYNYNSTPRFGMRGCDVPTCQRAHAPVHFNLRFPLLFCSRALEVGLSLGAVAGAGASLHLRVARALPVYEDIWSEVQYGKIERVRLAVARREVSPIDGDQVESILDHAVLCAQYDLIMMFLEEFASILRGTDYGKRAAKFARLELHDSAHSDREIYILQRVIALDDENVDDRWPIHEAVRYHGDLTAVLEESTEGIDVLDSFGNAPLHWAVEDNDNTAVRTLINYGANLNIENLYHYTPLMYAAQDGDSECAESLINGGCDVNACDNLDQSAVYFALRSRVEGTAKMVRLLMDHGARLTTNDDGNALHWLASSTEVAETEGKFQILVRAGVNLEEEDKYGRTPLMRALVDNHKVMLRLLLDAGCEFYESPSKNNTLIKAAYWADAESMDILGETEFTVDVRVRNGVGHTPLDTFEWRMGKDRSQLFGQIEPPSDDDVEAFRRLLQGVRDRYLTTEIRTLETVIQYLKEEESTLARETLQPIIQEKIGWNIPAEHRTFRTIGLQIKEGMIEAAIESLEEFVEVSKERIGTDPFKDDYCSRYGMMDEGVVVENPL